MSKREVTPKKLFGYVLLATGIILFLYVTVDAILLVNGTLEPIKIEMAGSSSGYDVFAGIILTIGLFAVLIGIAYGIAKIGLNIIKD